MSESTSILELPTDPAVGGNIKLNASENMNSANSLSLDESTINQIISGLQQATLSSATLLPSRDIPRTSDIDAQIQPNYIPQTRTRDYIKEEPVEVRKSLEESSDFYSEIQIPLLLTVLYFLFQLPIFKKYLFTYIPALFSRDGNYNIKGFIFTSVLFGGIYYKCNKLSSLFNAF